MRKKIGLMFTMLVLAVSCGQVQPTPEKTKLLGAATLELDSIKGEALMTQAALPDSSITNLRRIFASSVDDANGVRWLFSTFSFTNNSGQTLNNLTFHAFHRASSNLGGTAISSMTRSDLSSITDTTIARSIKPTHGMFVDGLNNLVNANTADFQAFTEAEASSLQSEALTANIITSKDSILQYGFTARSTTTGGREIPSGGQGRVTIAVRFPINPNPFMNPTRFSFQALLSDSTVRRVTRSVEESSVEVENRKNTIGASQVVEIGTGSPNNTVLPDIITSIEGVTLLGAPKPFAGATFAALRHGTDSMPFGSARAYFVDIININTGAVLKTIPIRTVRNGNQQALTTSGLNPQEGLLTRSSDGKCLIFTGYNDTVGTGVVNGSNSPRGVAAVYPDGAVSTSTQISDAFQTRVVGGATSDNCSRFWVTGSGGIRLVNLKSSGSSVGIVSGLEVYRHIKFFDFFAYVTLNNSSTQRIASLTGIPTTGLDTPAGFPGISTSNTLTDFVLYDLDADVFGVDTMYVTNRGVGVQKYSLVGGSWTLNGTAPCSFASSLMDKGGRNFFVTEGNKIYTMSDPDGYNMPWSAPCTVFATAASGLYSGIAPSPMF
jgi:hypothetical protein